MLQKLFHFFNLTPYQAQTNKLKVSVTTKPPPNLTRAIISKDLSKNKEKSLIFARLGLQAQAQIIFYP